MIDAEGFRANVGIVICNNQGQVFWARRYGQHSWQFPKVVWTMVKQQSKPCTGITRRSGLAS